MNTNVSNNDIKEEVSFDKGQYIAFYVILFLILIIILITGRLHMNDIGDSFKDVFQRLYKEKINSFYFVLLCILPIFCIFYGPIIFTFHVTATENFDKGCISFVFAHIFTNIFYPTLLVLRVANLNYLKYCQYRKVKTTLEYSVIVTISEKNDKYYTIIGVSVFLLSFIFYFLRSFISECNESNLFFERLLYFISLCVTYLVFNIIFIMKKFIIQDIYDDPIEYYTIFFNSFNSFFISFTALLLYYLTENNFISREVFYSVLLFINLSYFIINSSIFVYVEYYFLHKIDNELPGNLIDKISFYSCRYLTAYNKKSASQAWKNIEKSNEQKVKEKIF